MSTVIESKQSAVMDGQLQGSCGAVWDMTHPELLSHESTEEARERHGAAQQWSQPLKHTFTRTHTHTRAPTHIMSRVLLDLQRALQLSTEKAGDERHTPGCSSTLTLHVIP